jgi:hypothetical protein
MSRYVPVEYGEHEAVDACRRAASRLRSRPGDVEFERPQLSSLVADLLDTVGTALATRPSSVPEGVRRAALRVASRVRATRERDALAGGPHDRPGGRGEVRPDAGRYVVDSDNVPFAASIRLGRMG